MKRFSKLVSIFVLCWITASVHVNSRRLSSSEHSITEFWKVPAEGCICALLCHATDAFCLYWRVLEGITGASVEGGLYSLGQSLSNAKAYLWCLVQDLLLL